MMFGHLDAYAGDPILSLNEAFQKDPRADKVNLSIGIYFDDAGRIPVLDCVRRAEQAMLSASAPKSYLPIEGEAAMRGAVQLLLFGAGHEVLASGRVATLQTVGSSGGLKVGADFLKRWLPASEVWVSDPTWDNHRAMFEGAGVAVHTYPYYDAGSGGLRFDALLETLRGCHCACLVTAHTEYRKADLARIARVMAHPLMIDGRNALGTPPASLQVITLGRSHAQ